MITKTKKDKMRQSYNQLNKEQLIELLIEAKEKILKRNQLLRAK